MLLLRLLDFTCGLSFSINMETRDHIYLNYFTHNILLITLLSGGFCTLQVLILRMFILTHYYLQYHLALQVLTPAAKPWSIDLAFTISQHAWSTAALPLVTTAHYQLSYQVMVIGAPNAYGWNLRLFVAVCMTSRKLHVGMCCAAKVWGRTQGVTIRTLAAGVKALLDKMPRPSRVRETLWYCAPHF